MFSKSLIQQRFSKSLNTYEENAFVQKEMAKKLIDLVEKKKYNSILEIGCFTGILTRLIKKNINFENYTANDIVKEAQIYIDKIISQYNFIPGDIEEVKLNSEYDLIISNACLQWCNNIEITTQKLINRLKPSGILALSIFGDNNLIEIKNIFQIENKNYDMSKLSYFISKYNVKYMKEEEIKIFFDSPLKVLKHIQATGVNAIEKFHFTKSKLKEFEDKYKSLYYQKNGVYLTYNPVYIIIEKENV